MIDDAGASCVRASARTALAVELAPSRSARLGGRLAGRFVESAMARLGGAPRLETALRAYARSPEAATLSVVERRFLDRTLFDLERLDAARPGTSRREVERLAGKIQTLSGRFLRNLARNAEPMILTPSTVTALPEDLAGRLRQGRGRTRLLRPIPEETLPFLHACPDRDLRREAERRLIDRARPANEPLLLELTDRRRELAQLMGRASWAEFVIEPKAARTPSAVWSFWAELTAALGPQAAREIASMRAILGPTLGEDVLRTFDVHFAESRLREAAGLNQDDLAPYFELGSTVAGLLELSSAVFGLTFRRVGIRAWHRDVEAYEIGDTASGARLGRVLLDLRERPGKPDQAYVAPLAAGRHGVPGRPDQIASTVLVMSLAPDADGIFRLREAGRVALFHEFGHVLHATLAQTAFARFALFDAEWDGEWREAPSQVLERWATEPAVLLRIGRDPRTRRPIPTSYAERATVGRRINAAVRALRQVYLGELDLLLHGETALSLEDADEQAFAVTGLPRHIGTCNASSFGHLAAGYDAGYYGYLWSEAWGADLYEHFSSQGVLDPAAGAAFRHEVLEPGWSRPAADSIRSFLGREPSTAAYLRALGA